MAGMAKTPSSKRRWAKAKALASLPMRMGTIGLWVDPILKPIDLKPSCILRVFFQSMSMRSGSACMISRALRTPPVTAGASEAVKMKQRALCFTNSISSFEPEMNPPMEPKDFEKVPMTISTSSLTPK